MTAVQGSSQSVAANLSLAQRVREVILSQRNTFPRFWADVTSSAEELGVDEPRLRRQRRPPKRLDQGAEPHQPATPQEHYKTVYVEAVDWMAAALANRFQTDDCALSMAERALLTADEEAVTTTAAFYQLDAQRLRLHTQMLVDVARERGTRLETLKDAAALLQDKPLRKVLPAADDLIRIILTAPATSCAAERTFSQVRRIKSWLRSTLGQERLNHAVMLAVHRERLEELDLETEVKEFVSQSSQRSNAFGRW
ncbi:Zinc finger MYM-type protein 1 [Amphibalanus amphitrite]|uniref:Zinc finger MYM-type protein 1 n=1 Tax=Amphibalanus amphitrite TaxID=1232801 RepID=A0A6A4X034_AMPAM|nr:Zinc finger MYM-type protein 1 [Amphibalanus amphitrite]